ncbi:hypothetical protein JEQ12_005350 [Ovis aries]|uniref:Glutamate-rich protein 4 n=1 Tax=Ovis aries TaxID=9940 RepID=A0A836CX43_SHEEP|nr:hypothetical protein JEQ12_005350 [Ovis aries]
MPRAANKRQKPDIPGSGGDPCQLTDDSLIVRSLEIVPEGKCLCLGESLARSQPFLIFTSLLQNFSLGSHKAPEDVDLTPRGNLRRVDVQLLGQLCSLGLEMGALREELVAFLEEEAEENTEEEEEDRELKGKLEGAYSPVPGHHRPPDFEMTI